MSYSHSLTNSFSRAIAHVDADCFFVSVELVDKPELRGRPVLVCNRTDERGVVTAASYEARSAGIRAGTPVFKARDLCPRAVLLETHFRKYSNASRMLMQILADISPEVEVASIDEAYVDMTGLRLMYRKGYGEIGKLIQSRVLTRLGITVSVGIASTKLLAKVASDYNKPAGLTMVPEVLRIPFLKKIPVGDVPGVGNNTESLFRKYGLLTAYDITTTGFAEKLLGKRGRLLINELNGVAASDVSQYHCTSRLPKSISHTRTFENFSSDKKLIYAKSIANLLILSERLRSLHLETCHLTFTLTAKSFQTSFSEEYMGEPSASDTDFINIGKKLFTSTYTEGLIYRASGWHMDKLVPDSPHQLTLFDAASSMRKRKLSDAVDLISQRFGAACAKRAGIHLLTREGKVLK